MAGGLPKGGAPLVNASACARVRALMGSASMHCAWLTGLALLLWSQLSSAQEQRAAALNWVRLEGAEDCVDGASLSRSIEERLGHTVFPEPSRATLVVEGIADKSDAGYRARLRIFDLEGMALGSREVSSQSTDCRELSETVAIVLSVMIDPEGALRATPAAPREPAPEPAREPEPAPPETPPAQAVAEAPKRRVVGDASVFGRLNLGALPEPALGVGAAVLVSVAPYATFQLEGVGFFDQEALLEGASAGGARLRLLYATLEHCPLFVAGRILSVAACAGARVGAMQSRGFDLDPEEKDSLDPIVEASVRARLGLTLKEPLRALLGAGLSVPLVRTLYEATRADGTSAELFETKAVGFDLSLGLGVAF